jgi:cytidylate kinase/pantoate ligase/cytidylate kinase
MCPSSAGAADDSARQHPPNTEATGFVVTIDGPAGAGKSSVARQLAEHFKFDFLDTGAMYRAITLACLEAQVPWDQADQIVRVADATDVHFDGDRVLIGQRDVTERIRATDVNSHIKYIADNPEIRRKLAGMQVQIAAGRCIVTEGRDQGTDVFPHAECKIFLTATPETRARRRHLELLQRGEDSSYEQVLAAQQQRDAEDARRVVGALRAADDAKIVYTDEMEQSDVIAHLATIVTQRIEQSGRAVTTDRP